MSEEKRIPTQVKNPKGLHQRYSIKKLIQIPNPDHDPSSILGLHEPSIIVEHPVDKNAEYFVLRLDKNGKDPKHINACRIGVQAYANAIEPFIPELAKDLRERYPVDQSQQSPVKQSLDELVENHLHFEGKTNDKWFLRASIKNYLEYGNVSGSFWEAIKSIVSESQPVPVTEGREWVTYEDNSDLIEKESDPLLLFDTGEVAYYTSKWPNAVITHFMVNSPKLPTH